MALWRPADTFPSSRVEVNSLASVVEGPAMSREAREAMVSSASAPAGRDPLSSRVMGLSGAPGFAWTTGTGSGRRVANATVPLKRAMGGLTS